MWQLTETNPTVFVLPLVGKRPYGQNHLHHMFKGPLILIVHDHRFKVKATHPEKDTSPATMYKK